MIEGSFRASYQDASAQSIAAVFAPDSPNCFNVRAAGYQISKEVTLTAAGTYVTVNLFTVAGLVKLYNIFGIFTDVTNVDDIEEVHLDVFDGTNPVLLSKVTNVVCDGCTLHSALIKANGSAIELVLLDADQVRIDEVTKGTILDPTVINAKEGATTYLRMLYKNVDTNLNCQMRWYAEWRSLCGSPGAMAVV